MESQLTELTNTLVHAVCRSPRKTEIVYIYDKAIILIDDSFLYIYDIPNTGVSVGLDYNYMIDAKEGMVSYSIEMYSDQRIFNKVVELSRKYEEFVNSRKPNVRIDDFRVYNNFDEVYTNMKAADGCKFIKVFGDQLYERYLIPIYSSNPLLTKQDKLSLEIYNIDYKSYLIKMFIFKKKINQWIQYYTRVMNMDRPLR